MFTENDRNELITLGELCEQLKISETSAYRLLRSGEIRAFQLGKHWKIPVSSVSEFISERCGRK